MSTLRTVILYHGYFVPCLKPYFVPLYKIKPRMYKITQPGLKRPKKDAFQTIRFKHPFQSDGLLMCLKRPIAQTDAF